jgi:glycosyltransferase involved in cell wall biosynthesis
MVLDFRDEWSENNKYFFKGKPGLAKSVDEALERMSVRNADAVISVTDGIVENFRKRYPGEKKEKFTCVTNGFDADDFAGLEEEKRHRNDRFTITYAGAMNDSRVPHSLFTALEEICRERPDIADKIRLVFFGTIQQDVRHYFERDALRGIVCTPGFLSYSETVKALARSDVLLMIEDQVEIADRFLSAKLFEYMGVGKPILALADEGNIKKVVESCGIGRVAPRSDAKAVKEALTKFYDEYHSRVASRNPVKEELEKFERKNTACRLAGVLDAVSEGKAAR